MEITHNKNNDWKQEIKAIGCEELIPFIEAVVEDTLEEVLKRYSPKIYEITKKYIDLNGSIVEPQVLKYVAHRSPYYTVTDADGEDFHIVKPAECIKNGADYIREITY